MEIVVEAPQVDSSIPEEDGVHTGGRDNDLHASGQEVTAPLLSIHRLVTFRSRPTSLLQFWQNGLSLFRPEIRKIGGPLHKQRTAVACLDLIKALTVR